VLAKPHLTGYSFAASCLGNLLPGSAHLLATIQACTHHSVMTVKSQQWSTPSESIAIYRVKETSFVCNTSSV